MRRARLSGSSARPRGHLFPFILAGGWAPKKPEGLGVEASFREVLLNLGRAKVVELRVKDRLF